MRVSMKRAILFTFVLIFCGQVIAQNWQWAQHIGSKGPDGGSRLCLDSSNNIYMTGVFSPPQGFFGPYTFSTNGFDDIFIGKLDKNGNFIWVKPEGGYNYSAPPYCDFFNEGGWDIIYEKFSNSLILTGLMAGVDAKLGTCDMGTNWCSFMFISKIDLNGNCKWIKTPENPGEPLDESICTDNNGNIYIYGTTDYFSYFNVFPLPAGGFLAKISSLDGSCLWAKNIFNKKNGSHDIKFLNNELFLSGICIDTLKIDTITLISNYFDGFISKFDTAGNVKWAKTFGGPHEDFGGDISVDADSNVYITGSFKDTAYFDNIMLTNGNNRDYFLAKYNNNGNIKWVQQAHADSAYYAAWNTIDHYGNIYVTGTFKGNATLGNYSITSSSSHDLFIALYNSNGVCLGVNQIGNGLYGSVTCSENNDFYLSGGFEGLVNFGTNTMSSYGNEDIFIARHDSFSGINETGRTAGNKLVIYENPSVGKVNIIIPDEFRNQRNISLRIYDCLGKLIQQVQVESNSDKILLDIQSPAKGIYNAVLTNGSSRYTGRIVLY